MDGEAVRGEKVLWGPASEEGCVVRVGGEVGMWRGLRTLRSRLPCGQLFGRQDADTRFVQSQAQGPDAVTGFLLSAAVAPRGLFRAHSWT